jgi:hypothetical protein
VNDLYETTNQFKLLAPQDVARLIESNQIFLSLMSAAILHSGASQGMPPPMHRED